MGLAVAVALIAAVVLLVFVPSWLLVRWMAGPVVRTVDLVTAELGKEVRSARPDWDRVANLWIARRIALCSLPGAGPVGLAFLELDKRIAQDRELLRYHAEREFPRLQIVEVA